MTTNSSGIDFFLVPNEVYVPFETDCIFENPQVTIRSTLSELSPPPHSSLPKTISVKEPDDCIIAYASCIPGLNVSMIVELETYNLDKDGKKITSQMAKLKFQCFCSFTRSFTSYSSQFGHFYAARTRQMLSRYTFSWPYYLS